MIKLSTNTWSIDNIETVLFDKDGTFIDLHYFWGKMTELRAIEIIKKFSLSKNNFNQVCQFLGYDNLSRKMLPDGITALYSRSKIIEILNKELMKLNINTTENDLAKIFDDVSEQFYENMHLYTKPIIEAIEFIKKLKKYNVKIGIVTSDSVTSTLLTLKHFQWEQYFDVVIGRESSFHTKESGEPTKLALQKLKANPKTTIMIGDAPMDYISAQNAKIEKTILVATGQISEQELKQTSPYTLNSLDKLNIN